MAGYGLPPGPLQAYLSVRDSNQPLGADIQQAQGLMAILAQANQQRRQQALEAALQSGDEGALARVPGGADILAKRAQVQGLLAQVDEAKRQSAFFSPENRAQFTTAGTPSQPAEELPPELAGPPRPAVAGTPGQFDLTRFAQAGAAQGIKGTEPLLNNLAIREQARATMEQNAQLRREQFQRDYDLTRQRSEDQKLSRIDQNQARMDMMRLAASLKQQPQEPMVPVKEPDGRVIYVPRSQSAGREVGGRVTDTNVSRQTQQLGQALEKANLPSTIAVVRQAEQITPELASFVTGPKSLLPDLAVPEPARTARQDVAKLFNITLKDRSGAAVTNQELERLKTEFGKGIIKTPQQLITAIARAKSIVEHHYQGIAASFGPSALEAYNSNLEAIGGTPFNPGAAPAAPASNIDSLLDKYK